MCVFLAAQTRAQMEAADSDRTGRVRDRSKVKQTTERLLSETSQKASENGEMGASPLAVNQIRDYENTQPLTSKPQQSES